MLVTAVCKDGFIDPIVIQNFVLLNAIEDHIETNPELSALRTKPFRTLNPNQWSQGQRKYDVFAWTTDREIDQTMVIWLSPNVSQFDRPVKKQSAKARKEGDDARLYMTAVGEELGAKEVRPKFIAIRLPDGQQIGFMAAVFEGHLRHREASVPTEVPAENIHPVATAPVEPSVEILATTEPVPHSRGMEDL